MRSKAVAYENDLRARTESSPYTTTRFYPLFKRGFEVVFSIALLIFILPVLVLTAIAIRLESKGPIFYSQERVGLNGSRFHVFKLRSMRIDAEKNGPQWATKNDPRVTRVGKFIRKTRIDEVPQLINVLRGDIEFDRSPAGAACFYRKIFPGDSGV